MEDFNCIFEDKEASELMGRLVKWAGYELAPGCKGGCHVIDREGLVMPFEKALHIAFDKLLLSSC